MRSKPLSVVRAGLFSRAAVSDEHVYVYVYVYVYVDVYVYVGVDVDVYVYCCVWREPAWPSPRIEER